jgi:hypothetical protein
MGEMADWVNDQDYYLDEAVIRHDDAGMDEDDLWTVPIWTTNEGERIPVYKMETSHLFNAMKMMFNHLAAEHGGQPVWFQKRYEGAQAMARAIPGTVAWWVVVMLAELGRRDDIPARYLSPLQEIREQVFGGPDRLKGVGPRLLGS